VSVATGKNWKIPVVWGAILKYITAPILAIIFSFVYSTFAANRNDPLHIFGFSIGHVVMIMIALGFILPRWFDVFTPLDRRGSGDKIYAPNVTMGQETPERVLENNITDQEVLPGYTKADERIEDKN
jgi:solute carrier family 6 (neurotransmitter transporter, GABA) member 1